MKKILLSLITGLLFGQVSGQSIQDTAKIAFFKEVNAVYQLKPEEKARLLKDGFVALERHRYPSFRQAFEHIYYKDLPVFVSSDAILHSVHASFEEMMSDVEQGVIAPKVNFLLESARKQLKERQSEFTPVPQLKEAALELDFYLTVAEALNNNLFSLDSAQGYHWDTEGKKEVLAICQPLFAENKERINYVLSYIHAQVPQAWQQLGYEKRIMDFAQFTTRGRYATRYGLDQYFKTMMWFGFVGWQIMPALEADYKQPENYQKATIAVYLLSELTDKAQYDQIEQSLTWMTGDSDDLTLNEFRKTAKNSGIQSVSDLIDLEKMKRFHQHLRKSYADKAKLPNHYGSIDFKLFGQRITLDARLQGILTENGEKPLQTPELMYALGAKDALKISNLSPTAKTNQAVKANKPTASQKESVYGKWLSMIQSLNEKNEAYPPAMKTPAWQAKTLNTQLNSWTHLRYNHVLYAKQVQMGGGCYFPHSFVEPNLKFWEALQAYAHKGIAFTHHIAFNDPEIEAKMSRYFNNILQISDTLKAICLKQINRTPLDKAEDYFLKCMLKTVQPERPWLYGVSVPVLHYSGWYPRLFYSNKIYHQGWSHAEWVLSDVHRRMDQTGKVFTQYSGTGLVDLGLMLTKNSEGKTCVFVGPLATYFEGEIKGDSIKTNEDWEYSVRRDKWYKNNGLESAMKRPQWVNRYVIREVDTLQKYFNENSHELICTDTLDNLKSPQYYYSGGELTLDEYTPDSMVKSQLIASLYPNPTKDGVTIKIWLKNRNHRLDRHPMEEIEFVPDSLSADSAEAEQQISLSIQKSELARQKRESKYPKYEHSEEYSISIYDMQGKWITNVAYNAPLKAEWWIDHEYYSDAFIWSGDDAWEKPLPSGTYVVKVVWGKYTQSARVVLVRE